MTAPPRTFPWNRVFIVIVTWCGASVLGWCRFRCSLLLIPAEKSCSGAISSPAPEPYVAFSRLQHLKTLMLEELEIFSLCLQRCITKCGLTDSFCLPKTSLWSGTWGFSVTASCSGQFTRGHAEAPSLVLLSWSYSVLALVCLIPIRWAVDPKELN